jgi:hypothetical protein
LIFISPFPSGFFELLFNVLDIAQLVLVAMGVCVGGGLVGEDQIFGAEREIRIAFLLQRTPPHFLPV